MIPVRPIISTSTGPIFARFSWSVDHQSEIIFQSIELIFVMLVASGAAGRLRLGFE